MNRDNIIWGQRESGYSLTIRQKNKVKGYEVNFYPPNNLWGESLGFYKNKKECISVIKAHKIRQYAC